MTEVNPHASPQVSGLSANPTQPGSMRGVFWLVTVCLFLSVAVLLHLGTIPLYLLQAVPWIPVIVVPLWFIPIITSDIRAGARRADPRRSGAYSFINDMAKAIGITFLIIVISFFSVGSIQMLFFPCRCAGLPKFEGFIDDTSGFPNEQPVLPAHGPCIQ